MTLTLKYGVTRYVGIRKAPRRIQPGARRPGRRSSSGFPPLAPTMGEKFHRQSRRELIVILLWPNFRHFRSCSTSLPSHTCSPSLFSYTFCIWHGRSRLRGSRTGEGIQQGRQLRVLWGDMGAKKDGSRLDRRSAAGAHIDRV